MKLLAERLALDEVFIFPAMGDEGLPVGSALIYLLERDALKSCSISGGQLGPIFLGRDYTDAIDPVFPPCQMCASSKFTVTEAVKRLVQGQIGAIFTGRMEYDRVRSVPCRFWQSVSA